MPDKIIMKKSYNEYANIYCELKTSLGQQSAIELFLVYLGAKKAARIDAEYHYAASIVDFCKRNRLFFEIADFKIVCHDWQSVEIDNKRPQYSSVISQAPISTKDGRYVIYISRDPERVLLAKASDFHDHLKFGTAMGYPICCVENYLMNLEREQKEKGEFVLCSLDKYDVFPFYNNVCLLNWGFFILSHYPCRPYCGKSEKMGRLFFSIIELFDPELAATLKKHMKSFVIYTRDEGIFYTSEFARKGNRILFRDLNFTLKSDLYFELTKIGMITVADHNNILVGKKVFSGNRTGVFIYQ